MILPNPNPRKDLESILWRQRSVPIEAATIYLPDRVERPALAGRFFYSSIHKNSRAPGPGL